MSVRSGLLPSSTDVPGVAGSPLSALMSLIELSRRRRNLRLVRFWIPTRLSISALWAQVHQPGAQAESEIVLHPSESGDRTHAQLLLQQHFDWGGPMVREAIGAIAQLALSACAPTVEDAAGGSAAGEAVGSEGGATSAQRSE